MYVEAHGGIVISGETWRSLAWVTSTAQLFPFTYFFVSDINMEINGDEKIK